MSTTEPTASGRSQMPVTLHVHVYPTTSLSVKLHATLVRSGLGPGLRR